MKLAFRESVECIEPFNARHFLFDVQLREYCYIDVLSRQDVSYRSYFVSDAPDVRRDYFEIPGRSFKFPTFIESVEVSPFILTVIDPVGPISLVAGVIGPHSPGMVDYPSGVIKDIHIGVRVRPVIIRVRNHVLITFLVNIVIGAVIGINGVGYVANALVRLVDINLSHIIIRGA